MSVAAEKLDAGKPDEGEVPRLDAQTPGKQPPESSGDAGKYIPPLPRVSIQVFCETPESNAAFSEASAYRLAGRAPLTVHLFGIPAAR